MPIINDEDVPFLPYETVIGYTNRLAGIWQTLPDYLYITPSIQFDNSPETNHVLYDLLSQIKEDTKINDNLTKFLDDNKQLISPLEEETASSGESKKNTIIKTWLCYADILEQNARRNSLVLHNVYEILEQQNVFSDMKDFELFWNNRESERLKIDNGISINELMIKNQKLLSNELNGIKALYDTDFEIDHSDVSFDLILKEEEFTLIELFNKIVLNNSIPFAYFNSYYKVLEGVVPPLDWKQSVDFIRLKLDERKIVTDEFSEYETVDIKLTPKENTLLDYGATKGKEQGKITVTLRVYRKEDNISLQECVTKILQLFPDLDVKEDNIQEKRIFGNYYFPDFQIDSYVVADAILNDKLVSNFLALDESKKATKKRTEDGSTWLYIHSRQGSVSVGVTPQIVRSTGPFMDSLQDWGLKPGQNYLRIHVSDADNLIDIEKFKVVFAKMLSHCTIQQQEIIDFYKRFIPTFGDIPEIPESRLQGLDTKVFVKNYSRNCGVKRIPKEISSDEIKGLDMIKFPRDVPSISSGIKRYPSDGVNQRYYTCDPDSDFPYIGLQENNLHNRNEYPYLPCCFKNPQHNVNGSIYRWYYNGEPLPERQGGHNSQIKTNKFLHPGAIGILPPNLKNLFMGLNSNYDYVLTGSVISPNSFIHAVMQGVGKHLVSSTSDERKEELTLKRASFAKELSTISLTKQSNYNKTFKEIKENILNDNLYFDPRLYTQLLEYVYNCIIISFDDNGFIKPRFVDGYYKFKLRERKNKPTKTLFIYETWGSESDHATIPQCELIVIGKGGSLPEDVMGTIKKLYDLSLKTFSLSKELLPFNTIFASSIEYDEGYIVALKQYIDDKGKVRGVDLYNGVYPVITVTTNPMPIMPIDSTDDSPESIFNDVEVVNTFIERKQKINPESAISLRILFKTDEKVVCSYRDMKLTFLLRTTSQGRASIMSPETSLTVFNEHKRQARYLSEYGLWIFSMWFASLQDTDSVTEQMSNLTLTTKGVKVRTITDNVLLKFYNTQIVVEKGKVYKNEGRLFNMDSTFVNDGKLVVPTLEAGKRLLYFIKLYSLRDIIGLITYKDRKAIREYILDVTDFVDYKNQIILHGRYAYEKWVDREQDTKKYVLYDHPRPDSGTTYFFKNKIVSDHVYMAQNTSSLGKCVDIINCWEINKYNKGGHAISVDIPEDLDVYSFVNSISIHRIMSSDRKDKILTFKREGEMNYVVLLQV